MTELFPFCMNISEGTPLYIPPLTYIVNKKIIKNPNEFSISYYFGPSSTFWSTL